MLTAPIKTIPEDLGGYQVCHLLGQGGFGEVWEARNEHDKHVALKFLPYADCSEASDELRSIQLVKHLRHPNLVRIEKVWYSPGYLVIAMELADGSLADLAQAYEAEFQSPIPADHICFLLSQAAEAIDFLNTHCHLVRGRPVGVQHCDIKPGNLLVFGETVKLCDFGLTTTVTSPLRSRRPAGTPQYSAPEVLQGRISEATDQFALAVTYCHLRCNRLPFPNLPEVYHRAYARPAADLSMLTVAERPILRRALASNSHERWPSCQAFIAELERVIG
jgi:serine/threonine protein kinase